MKTETVLLAAGLGLGAWYLLSKNAQAQTTPSGGGGGVTIPDLEGMIGGLASAFQQSSLLNLSGLNSILGGFSKSLNSSLSGLGKANLNIPDWSQFIPDWSQFIPDWSQFIPDWDKVLPGGTTPTTPTIPKVFQDAMNSWLGPWRGITDPLHQANVDLANMGKGITESVETVTAVGRTAAGGFTNAVTGQSPWWTYILGPVGAVIGGMWTEAGQIVKEKTAGKGTVVLGPATLETIQQYGGEAAMHAAAQQLAINQQKRLTPQKQAAAREVSLGRTTEGPSGIYSDAKKKAALAQKALSSFTWGRIGNFSPGVGFA